MKYKDMGVWENLRWYGYLCWELGRNCPTPIDTEEEIEDLYKQCRFYENLILRDAKKSRL